MATMRVLGTELVECPLVATTPKQRYRGHARVLMSILEKILAERGVSVICLPAADATPEQIETKKSPSVGWVYGSSIGIEK